MKSTGIVRNLDELGRVTLPIELRRVLNLNPKSPVEIYAEKDMIVLKLYKENCIYCNSNKNIINFKDQCICDDCLTELSQLKG